MTESSELRTALKAALADFEWIERLVMTKHGDDEILLTAQDAMYDIRRALTGLSPPPLPRKDDL